MAGNSLRLADCASLAIDPRFVIDQAVVGNKPACLLYQQTSDAFFEHDDPKALLGGPIDLAFLDGMHKFEFLLRDFINTERHAARGSMIVMHDCLPPGFYMTTPSIEDPLRFRSRFKNYWTGDVWRIVPALQRHRPELRLQILDSSPTGLVLVTGLNPESTVPAEHYDGLAAENVALGMSNTAYDAHWHSVDITRSAEA